jgi:hypothetical protein
MPKAELLDERTSRLEKCLRHGVLLASVEHLAHGDIDTHLPTISVHRDFYFTKGQRLMYMSGCVSTPKNLQDFALPFVTGAIVATDENKQHISCQAANLLQLSATTLPLHVQLANSTRLSGKPYHQGTCI